MHARWSDEPYVFSSFLYFSFWEILPSRLSLNCLVRSSYKAGQFQLFVDCVFWEKFLSRLSLNCLVRSSYNAGLFQLFVECVFWKNYTSVAGVGAVVFAQVRTLGYSSSSSSASFLKNFSSVT